MLYNEHNPQYSNNFWRNSNYYALSFKQHLTRTQRSGLDNSETSSQTSLPPTVTPSKSVDLITEFRKTIKRNKNNYPILTKDENWDIFNRKLIIIPNNEGIQNLLDPNWNKLTTEEIELDKVQNR